MSAAHIYADYEEMLRSFRCQDLANLLTYTGQSRNGKKAELLDRCLSILKRGNVSVQLKIKEIYNNRMAVTPGSNYLLNAASSCSSTSNSPDPHTMLNANQAMSSSGRNMAFPNYAPSTSTSNSQYAYNNQMSGCYTRSTTSNPYQTNYSSSSSTNNFLANMAPNILSSGHELLNQITSNKNIKVVFEQLAFYEFLCEIDEPKKLLGVASSNKPLSYSFNFFLSTDVVNQVIDNRQMLNGKFEYEKQIHLRFGYVETSEQKDVLPNNLILNVNGKPAQLPTPKPTSKPNADIVRPGRSIEITSICRLAPKVPNKVDLSWTNSDPTKCYCVGVYLFRKIPCNELIKNLTTKCVSNADLTRKMVVEKLGIGDDDLEIETPTLKVSLQCPLMKFRIRLPARSNMCKHVQCFDAESYLMMNEKKPTWNCPVCDIYAPYHTLFIDGLFKEILAQEKESEEVLFTADGNWTKIQQATSCGMSKSSTDDDLKHSSSTKQMSVEDDETYLNISDSNSPKTEKVTQSTSATKITNNPAPAPPSTTATTTAKAAQASKDDDIIDLTADSDEEETTNTQQAMSSSALTSNSAQPIATNRPSNPSSNGNQMSSIGTQSSSSSGSNKRALAMDDELTNEQLSQLLSDERRSNFNTTINNLLLNKELQNLVTATSTNLPHGPTSLNGPIAITRIQDLFSDETVQAQTNQPTSPSDSIISIYSDDQTDTPVASQQQQETATTTNNPSSFSKSRETQSPNSSTNSPISTPDGMPNSNKYDSLSPLLNFEINQQIIPNELAIPTSPHLNRPSLDEVTTANLLSPSHSGPGSPSIINRHVSATSINKPSNNAIIKPPRLLNSTNNESALQFSSSFNQSNVNKNYQATDESSTHIYKRSTSSSSSSSSSSNKLNGHTTLNNRITQPVYRNTNLNKEKALKIVEEVRSNAIKNNSNKNPNEASYHLKSSHLGSLISNTLKRNSCDTDLPTSSSSSLPTSSGYSKSNYHSNHNHPQNTHHNQYQHQHTSYHSHNSNQYQSNTHGPNDRNVNNNNFNTPTKPNNFHHNYSPLLGAPYGNSPHNLNNNSNNQFFLNNKPVSTNQIRSNNLGSANNPSHNNNIHSNNRINQPMNNNRSISYNNVNHSIPRQ